MASRAEYSQFSPVAGIWCWGHRGASSGGNTAIGLALIMVLPLMRYCQVETQNRWVSWGLSASMMLTVVAIIATHSRGALLGILGAGLWLIIKSGKKLRFAFIAVVLSVAVLSFMPQNWFDKMGTIQTYEEDRSALGRINAWWFAFNLAVDRPAVGGGFRVFSAQLFRKYAPEPEDFHDAHSIYFEVLAEQGFLGLFLYLALGVAGYLLASRIIRRARGSPDLQWASSLAAMIQIALVGYAVSGAFLGLAYFDLYYHLLALLVLTKQQVELGARRAAAGRTRSSPRPRVVRRLRREARIHAGDLSGLPRECLICWRRYCPALAGSGCSC